MVDVADQRVGDIMSGLNCDDDHKYQGNQQIAGINT